MADLFSFVSLRTILNKKIGISKPGIKKLTKEFQSNSSLNSKHYDLDVQSYINHQAIDDEIKGKSRTYFIMDNKKNKIYLYFTLVQKSINLIGLPKWQREVLIGDSRSSSASGLLLAQLGKNYKLKEDQHFSKINTMIIWDYINKVIQELSNNSFRPDLIVVDCKPSLKGYYEKLGFMYNSDDNMNHLIQMYKKYV